MRKTTGTNCGLLVFATAVAILVSLGHRTEARDFYVDPTAQGTDGDGSGASPWRTLDRALDETSLEPGDTIYLRSGNYGALKINKRRNEAVVTIAADNGHEPRFTNIRITASSNWYLRGLSISPSYAQSPFGGAIVYIGRETEAITLEDSMVMSAPDSSSWTAEQWNTNAFDGIAAGGTGTVLRGNRLKNVDHGISFGGSHSLVETNVIENFAGDGIRGLGNHTTYRGNTIKNCYAVDDNHDDGFQSWSIGDDGKVGTGEVIGVILSGNKFINNEDPNQPLRCTMQGIGLFDGTYVDWVIENNVVITDHWHGITVMGGRNVRIVNNTVIDARRGTPGPPWITITSHRLGHPSRKSFIINNLSMAFNPGSFRRGKFSYNRPGVTARHNMRVIDPATYFRDPANGDLRLKPGSRPIDAGTADMAPATDIEGVPRPRGKAVDVGAYEAQ